jgi:DNA-binding MarR family transcriptional regulator
MNAWFFASKRAFHGILRVTRKPLKSLGLTAARFDMMYARVYDVGFRISPGSVCKQSDLRRALGVTAPVVSRMLRSLEVLGLVTRHRPEYGGDRRQRYITVTEKGMRCIETAHQALRRASWRLLCEAICFGTHRDPQQRFLHMCKLESYLDSMRRHYGDTAHLAYPWHPDD